MGIKDDIERAFDERIRGRTEEPAALSMEQKGAQEALTTATQLMLSSSLSNACQAVHARGGLDRAAVCLVMVNTSE